MRLADATLGNAGLYFFLRVSLLHTLINKKTIVQFFWNYLFAFDVSKIFLIKWLNYLSTLYFF